MLLRPVTRAVLKKKYLLFFTLYCAVVGQSSPVWVPYHTPLKFHNKITQVYNISYAIICMSRFAQRFCYHRVDCFNFYICSHSFTVINFHAGMLHLCRQVIKKRGPIRQNIVNIIFVGPPGAGKTTTKMCILNLVPSRIRGLVPSTGIVEAPLKVTIRKLPRSSAAIASGVQWTLH